MKWRIEETIRHIVSTEVLFNVDLNGTGEVKIVLYINLSSTFYLNK